MRNFVHWGGPLKSTITLFFVAMASISQLVTAQATPAQRPVVRSNPSRDVTAASARSFVALPFPSPLPSTIGNVVFTPNGTAYFTDAPNELASFTRAGVYTRIPVPHAIVTSTLIYARGVFWMVADRGIVKVAPDGTRRRWYTLAVPGSVTSVESLVPGPDGAIYAFAAVSPKVEGAQTNLLIRIGTDGTVTMMPLSVAPGGAGAFGPDKLLYFGYTTPTSSGVARLEPSGSLTLFPIAGSYYTDSFVVSKGALYFNETFYDNATSSFDGKLGRITPAGVISFTAFPATGPNTSPSSLAVDQGGNLWVQVNNIFGVAQDFLYQFNVYTGHFNGPYLAGLPNRLYGGPAVAPDDSVWITVPGAGVQYYEPIGFGIFVNGK